MPGYTGRWTSPPLWYSLAGILSSILALLWWFFLGWLVYMDDVFSKYGKPTWFFYPLMPVSILAFIRIVHNIGNMIEFLRLRRRMPRFVSEEQLRAQLGPEADAEAVERLAWARGIRPRCRINGEDFYDERDLGDVATLLRPAAPPSEPEAVLLRPAGGRDSPPEQLLRAADGPEARE